MAKNTIKSLIRSGLSPAEVVCLYDGLNYTDEQKTEILNFAYKFYNH
jgi:hypothetical protein